MYKVCPNCGFMYDDAAGDCPQCQNNNVGDVSVTQAPNLMNQFDSFGKEKKKTVKPRNLKKVAIIVSSVVVALIIVFAASFAIYSAIETKRQDEYNAYVSDDYYNEFDEMDDISSDIPDDTTEFMELENVEFHDAEANSILSDIYDNGKNNEYGPYNVLDSSLSTCWAEGESGSGQGCFIKLYSDDVVAVNEIDIMNGYCKTEGLFYKNNRVKELKISFSDGTEKNVMLSSEFSEQPNHIVLDEPVKTTYIKFEIVSVYEGTAYDDTCISEISVSGYYLDE